ncbi:MAG: hypothetical protein LQ343_001438 [Gyalolechia ehrenbergii]|nr:MAG: hypothetical protein LQ343_001438 [Gyalolechia ehrenbergii]
MGISGLLPLLKSIQKPCHLKKFAGQTIGVDAYGWLHRGTVACAIDLALGTPTTKFVDFSMSRVRMLIYFGVNPYLVFDGDYLPSKAATEVERRKKREESRRLGLELYRMGKVSQAQQELQKAVDVTPEMARQLIEELKEIGVQYVVAPYEADAQLAYLEKKGVVQGILSEDSDLLVFGAKRLLTKLEQYGDCVEISRDDFTSCRAISLVGWTDADFRRMAILSGCDYLANINKMGLKTAYRLVRKHKTIEKILRMLQLDGHYHVPTGYLEAFHRAELTFLHQRVFCPTANDVVMMTLPPPGCSVEKLDFLGVHVEKEIARGLARGDLHPMTKKPIVVKSKISQSPRTPWSNTRGQTAGTPSDLKSNKSIDAFFKAGRTPLAELDPNSFTPSPSQQRLLHRTNGSWTSSPAPARASLARPTTSLPLSESRSSTVRPGISSNTGSSSVPHPPKRRRLCSDPPDPEEAAQKEAVASERSKYFAATKACPIPSVKGREKKASSKAVDFNIWSDDSIEDAMAELPDLSQPHNSPRAQILATSKDDQVEVKQHPADVVASVEDKSTDSQSSTASRSTLKSRLSTCTSGTSVAGSVESQSPAKPPDMHVQSELATLRKEYLYQPQSERCRVQRQEIVNRRAQVEEKPRLQRKGSMTPLQRLGASALNGSYSCHPSLNRTAEPREKNQAKTSTGQLPKLADVLGSSSQPAATAAKVTVVNGSEDLMVPESEAESEGSQEEDRREKPGLNLGRFAFTG